MHTGHCKHLVLIIFVVMSIVTACGERQSTGGVGYVVLKSIVSNTPRVGGCQRHDDSATEGAMSGEA